ncbi:hypothetical protein PBAL39_01117 [Pedobacter sp. BAL39]|uniref:hypothetical protein n=1 Tax=Pedobacter sp. BAL39 TaxID=391596 RepID=UPI000155A1AA|nr:hypothetical protein [Pedobacter sp. BAL39]EDM38172.1 hypothetical protein PBAL39_01117 [Pedobacter sp. BAL39]
MENTGNNIDPKHIEDPNKPSKPIETDYEKHQEDPGPSPEAVNEYDRNGASKVMKWIIPILVVALLIYWLAFRNA